MKYQLESIINLENSNSRKNEFDEHSGAHLSESGTLYVSLDNQIQLINIHSGEKASFGTGLDGCYGLTKTQEGIAVVGHKNDEPLIGLFDEKGEKVLYYGLNREETSYPEAIANLSGSLFLLSNYGQLFSLSLQNGKLMRLRPALYGFDTFSRAKLCASQEDNCLYAGNGNSYGSSIHKIKIINSKMNTNEAIGNLGMRELTALTNSRGYLFAHRIGGGGSNEIDALKKESNFRLIPYIPFEKDGEYYQLPSPSRALSAAKINGKILVASVHKDKVLILSAEDFN